MFSVSERQFILDLARQAIEYYFANVKLLAVSISDLPSKRLAEKRSCFVTLHLRGNLRGCIGHIEPKQPLYFDIIENAVSAAFADHRFLPLTAEEYENIELEVSVLTVPLTLLFTNYHDLLNKLHPNVDGVIIRRGRNSATYLPQVWEDLPDKEEFLSSLCLKGGLPEDDWKKPQLEVLTYQAEVIK